ncbi:MAG: imidazolonepropionase [Bacillota bacterium]
MKVEADLVLSAGQLVTMAHGPAGPVLEEGAVACLEGRVVMVGSREEVEGSTRLVGGALRIERPHSVATPGLIDCHSHPVFGGWRAEEFEMRLGGADYMEVLKAGGGILNTVRATRAASPEELFTLGRERLDAMLKCGTTTLEAKSGYGLDTENEVKCLRVTGRLGSSHPVEVLPTFLGAHAVPPEFQGDPDGYVDLVCQEMIPRVAQENLAVYVDVFCEVGAFSPEQSRRVLECGMEHGMKPRLHADEFRPSGGAELAAMVGALSADHLVAASREGLRAMARSGTVAVLLPGTPFFTQHEPPNAGRFRDAGVPMALATDFNPGSCTLLSLPLTMSLACLTAGMSPWEALQGCTCQAAKALGVQDRLGTLEPGKQADITLFDAPSFPHIPYRLGHNLVELVIKRGRIVLGG